MKVRPVLQFIEQNQRITFKEHDAFLFEYQRALLLALKECGRLTETQYCRAEQNLKRQCQKGIAAIRKLSCAEKFEWG